MHSDENATYRLDLARETLRTVEEEAEAQRWPVLLNYAQQTVENAGKSILLHFRPIPRTHDVDELLDDLLASKVMPTEMDALLRSQMDIFRKMGMETHLRAAYGDEEAHITPWNLIIEPEAQAALAKARRAVALAQTIFDEMTKP